MDLIQRLEERRSELGLSQLAVATRIGVSQPHFSKIIGRIVPLTADRAREIEMWLAEPPGECRERLGNAGSIRIRRLARSIEKQLRELNHLLDKEGVVSIRRTAGRSTTPNR